jgi:hypothetical protein
VSKKVNPARFVTFTRDHVQVHPATVLESHTPDGRTHHIADIPEKRTEYKAGQTIEFGSVNAARAFVKALNETNPGVCRLGRGCPGCLLDSTTEKNTGKERTDLFATYGDARRALIKQGATRAKSPEDEKKQFFYRPAPAFPGQWGEALLLRRSDGWWIGSWILGDPDGAADLPFVDGLEGWGQP